MLGLTEEQVAVALGCMKTLIDADGRKDVHELKLLEVVAKALGGSTEVPNATAARAALAFPDALSRQRLVQALVATALIDGEASREELACLDAFAKELQLDDPWVKNVHRLVDGQLLRLRVDFARRVPIARQLVKELWTEEGFKGIYKLFNTVRMKGIDDPDLAWKYKQLGLLPRGTYGREFWEHMTSRKFSFPGEPGGLLEKQLHHDLTHVLCDYDTDPEGECQIAAFYAGYYQQEPFSFLFLVLVMFNVGVSIAPNADFVTTAKLKFDPEKVLRAMQRGSRVKVDMTDHWDFWPLLEKPIDDVRRQLGVS